MPCDCMGKLAILLYTLRAFLECIGGALVGIILGPLLKEKPKLQFQPTPVNQSLVDKCPAFQSFAPAPWAPGAISQVRLTWH